MAKPPVFSPAWCDQTIAYFKAWQGALGPEADDSIRSKIRRLEALKSGAKPSPYEEAIYNPDPSGIWSKGALVERPGDTEHGRTSEDLAQTSGAADAFRERQERLNEAYKGLEESRALFDEVHGYKTSDED